MYKAWALIIVLVCAVLGCSGTGKHIGDLSRPDQLTGKDQAAGLPTPSEVLTTLPDQQACDPGSVRKGCSFIQSVAHRVTAVESGAHFTPNWDDNEPLAEDMAYAIYNFTGFPYNRIDELIFEWESAPVDISDLWIGLANWQSNSWDWYPGNSEGVLDIDSAAATPYQHSETQQVLIALSLLGSEPATMSSLGIGQATLHVWPMQGQNPQRTHQSPFIGPQTNARKWVFTEELDSMGKPEVAQDGTIYVRDHYGLLHALNPDKTHKYTYHHPNRVLGKCLDFQNGTIYASIATREIHSINPDGTARWAYPVDHACIKISLGPDQKLYAALDNGTVHVINPDGSQHLTFSADRRPFSRVAFDHSGNMYLTTAGMFTDERYFLMCFAPDGTEQWSFELDDYFSSHPSIGPDGTVYVTNLDNNLYALNSDGTVKWTFASHTDLGGDNRNPPIDNDGTVYLGTTDGQLHAINPDGSIKWSYTGADWAVSVIQGPDGVLYFASGDRSVHALNPDGTEMWSAPVNATRLTQLGLSTDGRIYVSNAAGFMALSTQGEIIWAPSSTKQITSSPVIGADDRIYGCYEITYPTYSHFCLKEIEPNCTSSWTSILPPQCVWDPVIHPNGKVLIHSGTSDLRYVEQGLSSGLFSPGEYTSRAVTAPDGTIYICGLNDYVNDTEILYSLKPSGEIHWQREVETHSQSKLALDHQGNVYVPCINRGISSYDPEGNFRWELLIEDIGLSGVAIADDDTIYVVGRRLYAISPQGEKLWEYSHPTEFLGYVALGPDETVYLPTYGLGEHGREMVAVNPNATCKWCFKVQRNIFMSPAVDANGTIYFGTAFGHIYAVDADGELLWEDRVSGDMYDSPAIGRDGTVYFGCEDGYLYAFGPGPGN